jgi:hypothetical protein
MKKREILERAQKALLVSVVVFAAVMAWLVMAPGSHRNASEVLFDDVPGAPEKLDDAATVVPRPVHGGRADAPKLSFSTRIEVHATPAAAVKVNDGQQASTVQADSPPKFEGYLARDGEPYPGAGTGPFASLNGSGNGGSLGGNGNSLAFPNGGLADSPGGGDSKHAQPGGQGGSGGGSGPAGSIGRTPSSGSGSSSSGDVVGLSNTTLNTGGEGSNGAGNADHHGDNANKSGGNGNSSGGSPNHGGGNENNLGGNANDHGGNGNYPGVNGNYPGVNADYPGVNGIYPGDTGNTAGGIGAGPNGPHAPGPGGRGDDQNGLISFATPGSGPQDGQQESPLAPEPTPEPFSWLLMGAGAAGLYKVRRYLA